MSIASTFSIFLYYIFFSGFLHLKFLIETKNMYFKQKRNKSINKTLTWVSRSIMRSEEILGSMPILQCLAIALLSSVSIANGGSIPCIASKPKKKKNPTLFLSQPPQISTKNTKTKELEALVYTNQVKKHQNHKARS